MHFRTLLFALVLCFHQAAYADDSASGRFEKVVGTWLFTIDFGPNGPPPFRELMTYNEGGTLVETNTTLNPHSALNPTSPLPLNGSDGHGTWQRVGKDTITFTLHKLLFCGVPLNGPQGTCNVSDFFGYLRVDGTVRFDGDTAMQVGDESRTVILAPDRQTVIFDFGGANATAVRVQ